MRKSNAGMTLIELLVVMAIIGIIASIAIPTYRNYVLRASRSDGKAALMSAAGALERCYTRFNSYAAADGCTVVFPVPSTNNKYVITAPTQTRVAFSLLATPQAAQADDTGCANFTLDNANARGVSGTKPWRECWGK